SRITENGWTTEFRIPLSQLRFDSKNDVQEWGINFQRRIARNGEISFWNRTEQEELGLVSKFGELKGIQELDRPMRLEVVPYISTGYTRDEAGTDTNPFYEQNDIEFKAGGDIKYGISSDFTLTATINPDFGQVEADPATINLSEFEIFFEERRPFFLEGSDIFNFGGTYSQNTFSSHINFYSRRIGRVPFTLEQGLYAVQDTDLNETFFLDFVESNLVTTIAGAAKVSGKTKNGFSLGVMNSYTLEETTNYLDVTNSFEGEIPIEPATNYFVGRLRQDLKRADAQIGVFGSSVNRNMSGSYLEDYLHESAYQLGVDAQYYWNSRSWAATGVFALSNVNGTEEAIARTQNTSSHYFGRIDSEYLNFDPSRTSLTGYFTEFSIGKYAGSGIRYSATYSEMSPEYEVNDIGFQERADYRAPHFYLEYLNVNSNTFQYYLLWSDISYAWNFDGDKIYDYRSLGGYFLLNNLWAVTTVVGQTGKFYNDRIARGGPIMRRPKDWLAYVNISTNSSKNVYGTFTTQYRQDAAGEYQISLSPALNIRPGTNIQLSIAPSYVKAKDLDQFRNIADVTGDGIADYLFSNNDSNLLYTEFRADITFSPTVSFQTFLRPYYFTADFYNYKTFSERKTFNFEAIPETLPPGYFTSEEFDRNFDWDYKSLQGNAVLRWEYRPGSTLFFVWQQDRTNFVFTTADFEPYRGSIDTFRQDPVNIFLIKLSYWWGS
ncbi:MAG: DUF5916 domain-containing protein, partial [Balneolales bacterium]|nr:DUF5916 domain-containing protein [Balneolales bacterium]